MYIIAVLSQDHNMLGAFILPEKKTAILGDGTEKEYKNPYTDLHLLTAKECCFPEIFQGQPEHMWPQISIDSSILVNLLGDARKYGKITNFGIVYLQTAVTMAATNYLPVERTEQWILKHRQLYPKCHEFTDQWKEIAEARGWAANALNRIRWCREDNSKGQGASSGRSGVNFLIQSLGAELSKKSIIAVEREFRGEPCNLLGMIHDEVLIEHPGKGILKPKENKNGSFSIHYEIDKEGDYWRQRARKVLEDEEAKLLKSIIPDEADDEDYRGICEVDSALFWAH